LLAALKAGVPLPSTDKIETNNNQRRQRLLRHLQGAGISQSQHRAQLRLAHISREVRWRLAPPAVRRAAAVARQRKKRFASGSEPFSRAGGGINRREEFECVARRNQACAAGGALLAFTWLAAPPHSPQSQIGSCVEVAPACEGGLAQLADPQRRAAQDRTLLRRLEQQTDDGMAAVDETEILSETLDVGDGGEEEEEEEEAAQEESPGRAARASGEEEGADRAASFEDGEEDGEDECDQSAGEAAGLLILGSGECEDDQGSEPPSGGDADVEADAAFAHASEESAEL